MPFFLPLRRWRYRRVLVVAGVLALLSLPAIVPLPLSSLTLRPWTLDPADPALTLAMVEQDIAARYGVAERSDEAVARWIAAGGVTLFDVREAEEYALGHLPGAIRVDPDINPQAFAAAYRDKLGAGPVVFYCSVGVRSSQLASRLGATLNPHAPGGVFNLRGGLFRWVAQGRALVAGGGSGTVHPYDANWQKLLERTLAEGRS